MKIPSSTQQHTPPPAPTGSLSAAAQDDGPMPQREVVPLQGEDGETINVVAPPPELLARIQAEVTAMAADATATTDGIAQHRAVEQPSAPPNPPDSARSEAAPGTEDSPQDANGECQASSLAPAIDDRQPFKAVLACKPVSEGRWHVTVGIGRDGCDPVFEPAEVAEWPDALDAVLGVYATAVARWAEQPRNPPTQATNRPATRASTAPTPATKRANASQTTRGKDKQRQQPGHANTPGTANGNLPQPPAPLGVQRPAPTPAPVAAGVEQITLF